jgi:putative ABC transport system substrate-binding protein
MATRGTAERGARANAQLSRRTFVSGLAGLGVAALLGGCTEQAVAPSPSSRTYRIGYLSGNIRKSVDEFSTPFLQQLWALGYAKGRDLLVEFQVANNQMGRLDAMVAELIAIPVDVIVAEAGAALTAAARATKTIPIVFTLGTDPVGGGFVTSLARPGGNITGVTTGSLHVAAKRVEVLKETVPGLERIAILWNANQPGMGSQVNATEQAARVLGIETLAQGVRNPTETDAALDAISWRRHDALVMLPTLSVVREDFHQVPDLVAKIRLPAIYSEVQIVRAGGLMHRSPDYADGHRRAALMVDRILKGAYPGDVPVQEPTQFLFAVNPRAAQRIGLIIPDSVLHQATEVV